MTVRLTPSGPALPPGLRDMIPMQSAVIARAKHTPARFVEIEPRRGVRRGDAMRKLREQDAERLSALLAVEQERRMRTCSGAFPGG